MNFAELIFMTQFLIVIGILLFKTWNVFNLGKTYSVSVAWLLFASFFLFYGIGFFTMLTNFNNATFRVLFNLESWLVLLNVLYIIIEKFLFYATQVSDIRRQRLGRLEQ
jgi:hypothetical protein